MQNIRLVQHSSQKAENLRKREPRISYLERSKNHELFGQYNQEFGKDLDA